MWANASRGLKQLPVLPGLYRRFRHLHGHRMLRNVNAVPETLGRQRALIAYTVAPFLTDPASSRFRVHTNFWRSLEMARLLGTLGYVVDVIDHRDHRTKVNHDYELLLGFGRAEDLAKALPSRTVKIYLTTGSQAEFANRRERERIAEVNQRRGCNLQSVRQSLDRSEYIRYFDAIACLGNATTAATFRPYFDGKIYCWNNHTYDRWVGRSADKNFEDSRRSFLYFAGSGQVLIGLDLVLEAFSQRPHLKLFVCGPFERERDFVACFRQELYESPNIYPIGWVDVGSDSYFELTKNCGVTVFPICAGASPGSVVVCMGQGLIPVVSREAGMDVSDIGIILPSVTVEDIGQTVDWISSQPPQWHKEKTDGVLDATRRDFSQEAFSRRFLEILAAVRKGKTHR